MNLQPSDIALLPENWAIIGLNRTKKPTAINVLKQFRKLALSGEYSHPNKIKGNASAKARQTQKFQRLSQARNRVEANIRRGLPPLMIVPPPPRKASPPRKTSPPRKASPPPPTRSQWNNFSSHWAPPPPTRSQWNNFSSPPPQTQRNNWVPPPFMRPEWPNSSYYWAPPPPPPRRTFRNRFGNVARAAGRGGVHAMRMAGRASVHAMRAAGAAARAAGAAARATGRFGGAAVRAAGTAARATGRFGGTAARAAGRFGGTAARATGRFGGAAVRAAGRGGGIAKNKTTRTVSRATKTMRAHAVAFVNSVKRAKQKREAFEAQSKANNEMLRRHKAEYKKAQNKAEWNAYNKNSRQYEKNVARYIRLRHEMEIIKSKFPITFEHYIFDDPPKRPVPPSFPRP